MGEIPRIKQEVMPLDASGGKSTRICISMSEKDDFRLNLIRTLFKLPDSRKDRPFSDGKLVSMALIALQGLINDYREESGVEFPTYEEIHQYVMRRQGKPVV